MRLELFIRGAVGAANSLGVARSASSASRMSTSEEAPSTGRKWWPCDFTSSLQPASPAAQSGRWRDSLPALWSCHVSERSFMDIRRSKRCCCCCCAIKSKCFLFLLGLFFYWFHKSLWMNSRRHLCLIKLMATINTISGCFKEINLKVECHAPKKWPPQMSPNNNGEKSI